MSEDQLQAKCVKWLWNTHPETRRCLFHIPNGGYRNRIEAAKFKAIGLVPGIPDLAFVWNGKTHYFELKSEFGKISQNQLIVHQAFLNQGVEVKIIKSLNQFKILIELIIS